MNKSSEFAASLEQPIAKDNGFSITLRLWLFPFGCGVIHLRKNALPERLK